MTEYIYPQDLVRVAVKQWGRLQNILYKTPRHGRARIRTAGQGEHVHPAPERPSFPDEESLKTILDVMYHVSFLTEESRGIVVRAAYIVPGTSVLNLREPPIRFLNPISFTVSEVQRVAPALDPTESILAICPCSVVNLEPRNSPLAIWGILRLGSEWWRLLSGKESVAFSPPNCFTISAVAPGRITASSIGMILFRLRAGQLLGLPLEDLSMGHIGSFLREAAESAYQEACKELGRKRYDRQKDSDEHPRQRYFKVLNNILLLAREHHHGATFIILPDEIGVEDVRLKDRLLVKYKLESPSIWATLISESVANRKYFDLYSVRAPKAKDLKSLIHWEKQKEDAENALQAFESFAASLSSVDGAVVLTKKLKLLGFGAEIAASSPSLARVKVAADPEGKEHVEKTIDSFGTRHRSALRLCSSLEQAVCFVISQDGELRAMRRVGPDLYMWDDVNLGRFGF